MDDREEFVAFATGFIIGIIVVGLLAAAKLRPHPHPRDTCPVCIQIKAAEVEAAAKVEAAKKGDTP